MHSKNNLMFVFSLSLPSAIRTCALLASIKPHTVSYVELLRLLESQGDPIEVSDKGSRNSTVAVGNFQVAPLYMIGV